MTGVVSTLKNNKHNVQWLDDITLKDAQNIDTYIKLKYSPRIVNNLGLYLNSDIGTLSDMIYTMNGTAWDRLYTSYTADYNPIWNVDGTETITEERDLQATDSGKSTNNRTGTDTTKHTGTDSLADSGTDTISHSGDYKTSHTGSDSVKQSGNTTSKSTGSEDTSNSGKDSTDTTLTKTISNDDTTTNNGIYGFNSSASVPSSDSVTNHSGHETDTTNEDVTYGHTVNVTNSSTNTDTVDRSDTTTYGGVETVTDTRKESTDYGKKSTNTKDLSDSTTYGSGETGTTEGSHTDKGTITTKHTRGGNIGVTMTQQMLQADLDYWKQLEAKFFERVCKDIVDMITYKIYTVSDESSEDVGGVSIGDYVKDIVPTLHEGVKIADVHIVQAERED